VKWGSVTTPTQNAEYEFGCPRRDTGLDERNEGANRLDGALVFEKLVVELVLIHLLPALVRRKDLPQ